MPLTPLHREPLQTGSLIGYAREELVAELGAAFLCADLDITPEVQEDYAS
jgi:antirestriction protein ArdC